MLTLMLRNGNTVELRQYTSSTTWVSLGVWSAPDKLDDGQWRHLALVRRSGLGGTRYHLFINGQETGNDWGGGGNTLAHTPSGYIRFGAANYFPNLQTYPGHLDRILLHGRALTDDEVQSLYRADIDRDGLWDITEHRSNLWRDLNADGVRQASEYHRWLSPYHQDDPGADHDNDGVSSADEQNIHHTNPAHPDSDGDLLPDGWELDHGLDPNDSSDATTLNRLLYTYNCDPNTPGGDTDGDGTSDIDEINGPDGAPETPDGSHPNDARDGGQPIPSDQRLLVNLGVGDQSPSHSEDYVLHVYRIDPDTGQEHRYYTLRSGGHGQYAEKIVGAFWKEDTYTFQIDWQSSNGNHSTDPGNPDGADFDYTFKVDPQNSGSTIKIESYDPKRKMFDQNKILLADKRSNVEGFLETVEPMRVVVTTVDIDIIHPATGRLAEDKEDMGDGGYVAIKRTSDSPVTKISIPRHPFFASFVDIDGGNYILWEMKFNANSRYKIVGGSYEYQSGVRFSPYQNIELDIEGMKRSLSRGNEKVELSLLIGGEQYLFGDVLDEAKFTVVEAEFDIYFRTFIPYQWVALPHPAHDIPGDGDFFFGEVAKGDHRAFDHTSAKYRTSQFGVVIPYPDLSTSRFKSVDGSKAYVPSVGITEHFDKATSLANPVAIAKHQGLDPPNLLSAAALADNVTGAPLKTNWGYADTSDMHFDLHSSSTPTHAVYNIHGSASEPIVVFAASIDWDVLLHIDVSDPLIPTYSMNGEQDGFPAYEVFIYSGKGDPEPMNTSHVYQWIPPLARDVLALLPVVATEPVTVPVRLIKQK
ncbi:MAG: hypothetical protein H7A51_19700 [Akkermansiaceae bacterium]|nr:hypothetical protein [Akkermansiaceae bacterium]